jgi:hypothetical protein
MKKKLNQYNSTAKIYFYNIGTYNNIYLNAIVK